MRLHGLLTGVTRCPDPITTTSDASGKPEAIIEKMVEGRVQKYYEQAVLLRQESFVREDKIKISDVVEAVSSETGHPSQIASFARFALGEGIERPAADPT
jgi:elongation factor Ts